MAGQEVVAMLLAGGQGSRLGVLTEFIAKPAVPFGSRYRIIDFPLSNCTNSGIENVGVLTQYQPLELNTYVGNGHSWDLDRNFGGVSILSPYQSSTGSDWYKGTANAIYQNLYYIDSFQPKYVLVLSGDHIYKMNYSEMINYHLTHEADATIAVLTVPWEEASRFGIMNTDERDAIIEFEEKPKKPKSNLASMGIYVFTWDVLRKYLIADEADPESSKDFGKDIIPHMLEDNLNIFAYRYSGYWKDVGTIYSLWEANMDLLEYPENLNLGDASWRIYSRNPIRPPQYIGSTASIQKSILTDGAEVYGILDHSVVANSVVIEEGATVKDSFLMPGCHIRKGARLERVIVGICADIGEGVEAGPEIHDGISSYESQLCSHGITVFEGGIEVQPQVRINANSMLGRNMTDDETVVKRFQSPFFELMH